MAFKVDPLKLVSFTYTNHRGETRVRRAQPIKVFFGTHPQYPTARWLMLAYDVDKADTRTFDMQKVIGWTP
jgi:predicted DNA-binding transcriptional regulator YafY